MKNKFIFLVVFVVLFFPAISFAIPLPTINLTVVTNTQGQDSTFHFTLTGKPNFDIQTSGLTGSKSMTLFGPGSYLLLENNEPNFKIDSILCASPNPNIKFFYNPNGVSFSPVTLVQDVLCVFNNVKARTPVLIVPGIAGTEMKKGDDLLWLDFEKLVGDFSDSFMDPLAFGTNLVPSDSDVSISDVIGKKIYSGLELFDYTEGLINEFVNQGYVEGETIFTFPYDWRYGVSGKNLEGKTNSDLLKEKIQEILQQTGADKVDVVAHSMGGLIVKKYTQENLTNNNIGKAVFVGVPNTGAPTAVKALVQGDNFGIGFKYFGLNDGEMKKLAENMPAVYDLLPSQKYYDTAGSFVSKMDAGYGIYHPEKKDLNYEETKSFLTDEHNLNSAALINAENLHTQIFDDFDMRSAGIDLYAIDGCKTGTLTNFLETNSKDIFGAVHLSYDKVDLKTGDGTVPIQSSTNLPIDSSKKYYALTGEHSKLLSQDGSRQEIVNLISGSGLNVSANLITQDVSKCKLNGKAIVVFSPVDILATDQFGNNLGLVNGNVVNEIPNAGFEIMGEHKFIYLPQDSGQIYNINMQGTGNGIFTLQVKDLQNDQVAQTENFINIPVTITTTGKVNLGQATSLTIDSKIILPTSTNNYDNFIFPVLPTSKNECKKDGWKNFGYIFKNQGDCVSFVQTGK